MSMVTSPIPKMDDTERHLLVFTRREQAEDQAEPEMGDDQLHNPEVHLVRLDGKVASTIEGDECVSQHCGDGAESEVEWLSRLLATPIGLA